MSERQQEILRHMKWGGELHFQLDLSGELVEAGEPVEYWYLTMPPPLYAEWIGEHVDLEDVLALQESGAIEPLTVVGDAWGYRREANNG